LALAVPSAAAFVHSALVRIAAAEQDPVFHRQPRFVVASHDAVVVNVPHAAGAASVVATHVAAAAATAGCAAVKVQPAAAGQLSAVGAVPRRWSQLGVPVQCSHACVPRQDAVSIAAHVHPLTVHESAESSAAQDCDASATPAQLRAFASLALTAAAKVHPCGQLSAVGADQVHPLIGLQLAALLSPAHEAVVGAVVPHVAATRGAAFTAAVAAVNVHPDGHSFAVAALVSSLESAPMSTVFSTAARQVYFAAAAVQVPASGVAVVQSLELSFPAMEQLPACAVQSASVVPAASGTPSMSKHSAAKEQVAVPLHSSAACHDPAGVRAAQAVWSSDVFTPFT